MGSSHESRESAPSLGQDSTRTLEPQLSMAAAKAFPTYDLTVRVYPGARHEGLNETNKAEAIAEVADFCMRVAP